VLRDLLRGSPTLEQLYGLARFLHTNANNHGFWAEWRELHDDSLRRLQAISFRLAFDWFACRMSESVQEETDRLPRAVQIWFRDFGNFFAELWISSQQGRPVAAPDVARILQR